MTAKFTSGPWAVVKGLTSYYPLMVQGDRGREICSFHSWDELKEANANLIAAAPELLALCQELLNCIDSSRDWDEAKRAKAAIKKALGK